MRHLFRLLILLGWMTTVSADWQSCLSIADDHQRLSCYDRYARSLNANEQNPFASPSSTPSTKSTTNDFGLPAPQPAASIEVLQAHIQKVEFGTRHKRILYLDNGQVWIQRGESTHPKLQAGDAIYIERGALGSFVLKKAGSNRRLRVRRIH